MTDRPCLPTPGRVLRELVTAAGYRPVFEHDGTNEDLDAVARSTVRGSTATTLSALEHRCRHLLEQEAGPIGGTLFADLWTVARQMLRTLAVSVDTTCIAAGERDRILHDVFVVPALADLVRTLLEHGPAPRPDAERMLRSPIEAWLGLAARTLDLSVDDAAHRLGDELDRSASTIRRWRAGEPTARLLAAVAVVSADSPSGDAPSSGHRRTVIKIAREVGHDPAQAATIDALTAWLAIAVALQSLPSAWREAMAVRLDAGLDGASILDGAIETLRSRGFERRDIHASDRQIALDRVMRDGIGDGTVSSTMLRSMLARIVATPQAAGPHETAAFALLGKRLSIRIAILDSRDDRADKDIRAAIDAAWWCAGWQQQPLLEDALLFAAGTARLPLAHQCLARLRLLVPDQYPWPVIDEQRLRSLGVAFARRFPGRKAAKLLPMPPGSPGRSGHYRLTDRDRAAPNARRRGDPGRTRHTPLMDAVDRGTLDDVDALLAGGGDPNVVVPESGDTAVTRALGRAARGQEGLAMLHRLCAHGVTHETMNHPAHTARETPLDLAIDLDDPDAVALLIEHGAAVDPVRPEAPRPLCRVLERLHLALHPDDPDPKGHWASGALPGVLDAWHGMVSVEDTARNRQGFLDELAGSPGKAALAQVAREIHRPDAARGRAVLQVLLDAGADPNGRDTTIGDWRLHWTPTLLAAFVGDASAFDALLNKGGDPGATLRPAMPGERLDARYLAALNEHAALVERLEVHARDDARRSDSAGG